MKNIVSTSILIFLVLISSECFSQKAVFPQKKKVFSQQKAVNKSEYLTDQSGNTYKTVKIGNDVWMAENFKGKHYSNGDAIEEYKVGSGKSKEYSEPIFCILKNDHYVYSWSTITDPRDIAPTGWHVPSKAEWEELISIGKNNKDLRSSSGWPIKEMNGFYLPIICPSCANWNAEYRRKVACHKCKDTRQIGTKYIPKATKSLNGTNRLNFNLKHLGYLSSDDHEMEKDAYWSSTAGDFKWQPFVLFIETYWRDYIYLKQIGSQGGMLPLRLVKNKENQNYKTNYSTSSDETKIPVVKSKPLYFNREKKITIATKPCDDFPFTLGCVNTKIGDLNAVLFSGNRYEDTYNKQLENFLDNRGYFSNSNNELTQDTWSYIMNKSVIK
jgi:hypothetical protein